MQGLASMVPSGALERVVVDRTGLAGTFDVELHWSPTDLIATPGPSVSPPPEAPSLFTAFQEQLGLKLEPRDELLNVVVIDRVERPTPN